MPPAKLNNDQLIEVWKRCIEVQMHFNTTEMNVRNIFATLVVAIIAAIGIAAKDGMSIHLFIDVPLASILGLIAIFITWMFYFMDRNWYHKLLLGSVYAAADLEKFLSTRSPVAIDLTQRIGKSSPVPFRIPKLLRRVAWLFIRDERIIGDGKIHSDGKISLFYSSVMFMFFLISVAVFFVNPNARDKELSEGVYQTFIATHGMVGDRVVPVRERNLD